MKIFKKWGKWKDIGVRVDYCGIHYLLQMKESEDGEKKYINREIDKTYFFHILCHGWQLKKEIEENLFLN